MSVLAIDPGTDKSAWVLFDGLGVVSHGICGNEDLIGTIGENGWPITVRDVAVEQIASYGMPVGREVFATVFWCGRFHEAAVRAGMCAHHVPRKDVKLHLCGQARAKDANIRQALLDRFGGRQAAVGTKKQPGPLFGIRADEWSALGLAITFLETV